MSRIVLAIVVFLICLSAWAQTGKFQPGANPMSNQGYDAAVITVATPFQVTRAIYNGNATACNFTATMNGGSSVQFQNNQPGTYNPIQVTNITVTTCAAGVLLAIY
jgi:hypothetical protein